METQGFGSGSLRFRLHLLPGFNCVSQLLHVCLVALCSWLLRITLVLLSIAGKTSHLYVVN